jgi:acyl-coenzyme A synthetase/AMP-(fatty) acid ligase
MCYTSGTTGAPNPAPKSSFEERFAAYRAIFHRWEGGHEHSAS